MSIGRYKRAIERPCLSLLGVCWSLAEFCHDVNCHSGLNVLHIKHVIKYTGNPFTIKFMYKNSISADLNYALISSGSKAGKQQDFSSHTETERVNV